jgi:hypothetical protein
MASSGRGRSCIILIPATLSFSHLCLDQSARWEYLLYEAKVTAKSYHTVFRLTIWRTKIPGVAYLKVEKG